MVNTRNQSENSRLNIANQNQQTISSRCRRSNKNVKGQSPQPHSSKERTPLLKETAGTSSASRAKLQRQISPSKLQKVENDAEESNYIEDPKMAEIFLNPIILKEILRSLSTQDLITASGTNKLWCRFAREVLRDRNCIAVRENRSSCTMLRQLSTILSNSSDEIPLPYTGLSMCLLKDNSNNHCEEDVNVQEVASNITRKINVQHLELEVKSKFHMITISDCCKTCVEIAREIFRTTASSLTSLTLKGDIFCHYNSFSWFIGLDSLCLPNIQRLELFCGNYYLTDKFLVPFIQASPKLRILVSKIGTAAVKSLAKLDKTHVIKEFTYTHTIESLDTTLNFVSSSPKFKTLKFLTPKKDPSTQSIFDWDVEHRSTLSRILQSLLSTNSLTRLDFHHFDLIRLVNLEEMPVMQNLKTMKILYCSGIDAKECYPTLRKINWTKYFPVLQEFLVSSGTFIDDSEHQLYIDDNFRNIPVQFTCDTVTKFVLSWDFTSLDGKKVDMFRLLFPNVTEFVWSPNSEPPQDLWAWENLEKLYIKLRDDSSWKQYESALMGIPEKRVTNLLRRHRLENVEIPPERPCLLNLKRLRTLVFDLARGNLCHNCKYKPRKGLTDRLRLSAHYVFPRMEGCEIKLFRKVCEAEHKCTLAMAHLQPSVKLINGWCSEIPEN